MEESDRRLSATEHCSCAKIYGSKTNMVTLNKHHLVDHIADYRMQQQSGGRIGKRITVPSLGSKLRVNLVHIYTKESLFAIPAASYN